MAQFGEACPKCSDFLGIRRVIDVGIGLCGIAL
jgi:hypothetical protein